MYHTLQSGVSMKTIFLILFSITIRGSAVFSYAENENNGQNTGRHHPKMGFRGEVVTTIDAATYTYVQVKTKNDTIWAAGTKASVAVGDIVGIPNNMPMKDFTCT